MSRLGLRGAAASRAKTVEPDDRTSWYNQPAYLLMFVGALALNMFSGYWHMMGIPVPLDRLLLATGLVLLLLDPDAAVTRRLQWLPLHWLMVLFTGWTVWSATVHGTLTESLGFYALVDRVIVPFTLFCLAPVIFDRPSRRLLLLRMLVLVGLYLGVTALLEMVGPSSLVYPRYIMNPDVGILFGRARGPFVAAEADGMVLAMCAVAAGVLYARSVGLWRLLCVVSLTLTVVGSILTMTRSIWLGAALAAAIFAVMVPAVRMPLLKAGSAFAALFIFVLVVFAPARVALIDRLTTQRSLDDRANTNAAGLRILAEQPLDGIGWARFLREGPDWVRQADTYPITTVNIEIHNVVLARAAELGIPATVIWVAIVLLGPVLAILPRQDGDLADYRIMAACFFVIWLMPTLFSPNPYPMPNYLFWLIGGIAASPMLLRTPAATSTSGERAVARG